MFTGPPPDGTPVSETTIEVRMPELDSFGHVNHAVFLTYLEHARFRALEEAGFSWDVLAERSWSIFVVRIEVEYLSEATRGDVLLVRTWADSFRRASMNLAQEIVRADDPSVRVTRSVVTAVWIGPDRKPMRLPPEVKDGLTGARRPSADPARPSSGTAAESTRAPGLEIDGASRGERR